MSARELAKNIVKELARAGFDKGDRTVKEKMWEAFAKGFLDYMDNNPLPGTTNTDETVKVSSNDNDAEYLLDKLVAGSNITLTENNDGFIETLEIAANVNVNANPTRIERFTAAGSGDTTYSLLDTPVSGTDRVYFNGQLTRPGPSQDYEITGSTLEVYFPVFAGTAIDVEYEYVP